MGRVLLAELVAALRADPVLRRDVVALLQEPRSSTGGDARVMSVEEVAAAVRVSERSVYRALRDGRLRGDRIGSRWRISAAAVEEWKVGQCGNAPEAAAHRRPGSYDVARRALAA